MSACHASECRNWIDSIRSIRDFDLRLLYKSTDLTSYAAGWGCFLGWVGSSHLLVGDFGDRSLLVVRSHCPVGYSLCQFIIYLVGRILVRIGLAGLVDRIVPAALAVPIDPVLLALADLAVPIGLDLAGPVVPTDLMA